MLYYLDTAIIIFALDGKAVEQNRAKVHIAKLGAGGHRFVISDLTRTECLIPLFAPGEEGRLSDYLRFFQGPMLRTVSLTSAMYERASAIRGGFRYQVTPPATSKRYSLADALHLATAIEFGCDVFLTNDNHLVGFPDILVEQLP